MFWIHVLSILLVGGLMLLFVGTLIDNTVWQITGLIGFVTGLITLLYSFKEADY